MAADSNTVLVAGILAAEEPVSSMVVVVGGVVETLETTLFRGLLLLICRMEMMLQCMGLLSKPVGQRELLLGQSTQFPQSAQLPLSAH